MLQAARGLSSSFDIALWMCRLGISYWACRLELKFGRSLSNHRMTRWLLQRTFAPLTVLRIRRFLFAAIRLSLELRFLIS